MVNSTALSELLALFESAEAFGPDPPQPALTSMIADAVANAANQRAARIFMRIFLMASSSFLRLPSIAPAPFYKMPRPGDRPVAPIGSSAPHPDSPADLRRRACKHTHRCRASPALV